MLPELPPRIEVERRVVLTRAERELYETARLAAATSIAEASDPSERFAVLGWLVAPVRRGSSTDAADAGEDDESAGPG